MSRIENKNGCQTITTDFNQILLNCALLCRSIYEENPKFALESCGYEHTIQSLTLTLKQLKLKYMICSIEEVKKLIFVFCETEQMDDYLTNIDLCYYIEDCEGSIHSTIARLSIQIPAEVFVHKILDGYDLVFTGHGLGGALASSVATSLLMHDKVRDNTEMQNRILTIAFGTPPFVDVKFKTFIEETKNLKNRFYFYINENDLVVKLFDSFTNSADKSILIKNGFVDKLNNLANDIIKSKEILNSKSLINVIFESLNKIKEPHTFQYFGLLFNSSNVSDLNLSKNNFDLNLLFRDPIKSHNMKGYFDDLKKSHLRTKLIPQINKKISDLKEFEIPQAKECSLEEFQKNKENAYTVKFIVNEFNTEIIISVNFKNMEFLHSATVKTEDCLIKGNTEFKGGFQELSFGMNVYSLVFSCSNEIFNNIEEKISSLNSASFHDISFDGQFVAHFNIINLKFSTKDKMFAKGLTLKKENIENMPLDLLYVSGLFYANVMSHVEDAQLRSRCGDLIKLFKELDDIWKLKNESHDYNNKKNRGMLQQRLKELFKDSVNGALVDENNDNPFADKHVNLYDYVNFVRFEKGKNKNEENLNEKISYYNDLELFLKSVFPTCFTIANNQFKKFNFDEFSKYLKDNCKLFYYEIPFEQPFEQKIRPIYKVTYCAFIISTIFLQPITISIFSYMELEKSYRKRLLCYLKKGEAQDCHSERSLELKIEEKVSKGELKKNDFFVQSILINKKIRDILCQDIFIAVVGKKKCGKSTFVKEITGVNTNADANIGTFKMQVCPLVDSIKIIDFPDCEKASHRLQFLLLRCILDHVFMVCDSKERADVDATKELLKLIRDGCGKHFTTVLNRIDDSLKDCKSNPDFGLRVINKLKQEVAERVKSTNILMTYLEIENQREMLDAAEKLKLITPKNLKPVIFKIFRDCIPKDSNTEHIKEKIEVMIKLAEEEAITRYKEIRIESETSGRSLNCIVTEKKANAPSKIGYEVFDSYEELQKEVKYVFRLDYLADFYLKGDKKCLINNLKGFLNTDGSIFEPKI